MIAVMRNFLEEQGVGEEEIQVCELAMAEAANNAIKYANGEAAAKEIGVEVLCAPEQLELRVNDNTEGFDWPKEIKLPSADQETGRGLFLINSLMDRVNYFRGQRQNCLVMERRRKPGGGGLLQERASESEQRFRGERKSSPRHGRGTQLLLREFVCHFSVQR